MMVEERYLLVRIVAEIGVVPDLKMTCHLAAGAERQPHKKSDIGFPL